MPNKDITLYLDGSNPPPVVVVTEADTAWTFRFTVMYQNAIYAPTVSNVILAGHKPDGNAFAFLGSKSGNVFTVGCNVQMTAVPGDVLAALHLLGGGNTAIPFILRVQPAGGGTAPVASASALTAYATILNRIGNFPPNLAQYVSDWLAENVLEGAVVDNTFTIEGAAAPAKLTGNRIKALEEATIETDDTLTIEGAAADAKAVGEKFELHPEFSDVFTGEKNGVAPKAPSTWVAEDGVAPDYGYFGSDESNWENNYDTENGTVVLKHTSGGKDSYSWVGCMTGLKRVRVTSKSFFNAYIMLGTNVKQLVGYSPTNGQIGIAHKAGWNTASGFTTIQRGKAFDLSVTETSFTVTVDGVSTTHDISQYGIIRASIGFMLTKAQNNTSLNFVNLDAGSGEYVADNTKFLRSDGSWQIPPLSPSAFPSAFKQALLECFRNVAWAGDDGADYFNALSELLNAGAGSDGWQSGVSYSNITTISGKKISSSTGEISSAEGWARTDFIPCAGASRLVFPKLYETAMQADNAAFYTKGMERASGITLSLSGEKEVSVPADAAFFAVSSETDALARLLSDGITPYA